MFWTFFSPGNASTLCVEASRILLFLRFVFWRGFSVLKLRAWNVLDSCCWGVVLNPEAWTLVSGCWSKAIGFDGNRFSG